MRDVSLEALEFCVWMDANEFEQGRNIIKMVLDRSASDRPSGPRFQGADCSRYSRIAVSNEMRYIC